MWEGSFQIQPLYTAQPAVLEPSQTTGQLCALSALKENSSLFLDVQHQTEDARAVLLESFRQEVAWAMRALVHRVMQAPMHWKNPPRARNVYQENLPSSAQEVDKAQMFVKTVREGHIHQYPAPLRVRYVLQVLTQGLLRLYARYAHLGSFLKLNQQIALLHV